METIKRLNSRGAPEQVVRIPVILPTHHQRGVYHGEIVLTARVGDDGLSIDLQVYGEGTRCPGLYRGTFSAADLGVSSSRRTAKAVREGAK